MDLELDFEIEDGVLIRYLGDDEDLVIPDTVTEIAPRAFEDISDLRSVVIPYGVTCIGEFAFCQCSDLQSIVIPETVKSIGEGAFLGCCSLMHIEIPDGVENIDTLAFDRCECLESVRIPASARIVGLPFTECYSLSHIYVEKGNPYISSSEEGDLYSADGRTLLLWCLGKERAVFVVPEGVEEIGEEAFFNAESLSRVFFPESLRGIGGSAFAGCISLVASCPYSGEANTSATLAEELRFPEGLECIGTRAFAECTAVKRVVIPEGLEEIGLENFGDCYALEEVILRPGVKKIGVRAFANCYAMKRIELPEGLVSIGDGAFIHCSALTDIRIPQGIGLIGEGAFFQCEGLKKILVPPINRVMTDTFQYCDEAESITLSEGTAYIDEGAFYGCVNAVEVRIPASIKAIAEDAFGNCDAIERIFISAKGAGLLPLDLQFKAGAVMACQYAEGTMSRNAKCVWAERIAAAPTSWLKGLDGNAVFYRFVFDNCDLDRVFLRELLEDIASLECRAMVMEYIHGNS